ncbi:MAG: hypothetical protein Q4F67_07510 [Propionibacteriaceae bacterium]|nr:hypothetical protein [Propionibacteriaceae bacterium]
MSAPFDPGPGGRPPWPQPPSQPPRPDPPRSRRSVPWGAVGAVATILAGLIALLAWQFPKAVSTTPVQIPSAASALGTESGEPAAGEAPVVEPRSAQPMAGECVDEDGKAIECGGADAWLIVVAAPCDQPSATRSLGADPAALELQVEAKEINGLCAVTLRDNAKAAGATIGDLTSISEGTLASSVLTCWAEANPSTAVPCNQPHRFEPVTAWRPVADSAAIEATCKAAARAFVAGPVDQVNRPLLTRWVQTQEATPQYRCLVESRAALNGTVYRLSGRSLPAA